MNGTGDAAQTVTGGMTGSKLPLWVQTTGDLKLLKEYFSENKEKLDPADRKILTGRMSFIGRLSGDVLGPEDIRMRRYPIATIDTGDGVRLSGVDHNDVETFAGGSWICAYKQMLASRKVVNLSQADIRSFRPVLSQEAAEALDEQVLRQINADTPKSPYDMGDLALITRPESVMHEIRVDTSESTKEGITELFGERIREALRNCRCPAALMINGRYYSISGIQGDDIEITDFDPGVPKAKQPGEAAKVGNDHIGLVRSLSEMISDGMSSPTISLCWLSDLEVSKNDPHRIFGLPDQSLILDDDGSVTYANDQAKTFAEGFGDVRKQKGLESMRPLKGAVTGIDRAYVAKKPDAARLRAEAAARSDKSETALREKDTRFGYDTPPVYDPEAKIPAIPDGGPQAAAPRLDAPETANYYRLVVSRPNTADALFGLPDNVFATQKGLLTPKQLKAKNITLDPPQKQMYDRLSALVRSGEITPDMTKGGMSGFRTLALLHYMHGHQGVSFPDVMDPEKDAEGKKAAAEELISAMERKAGIGWMPEGGKPGGKLVRTKVKADDNAMVPIISGAITELSRLDAKKAVMQSLGRKDNLSADETRAVFAAPENRAGVRETLAALSDFGSNGIRAVLQTGAPTTQHALEGLSPIIQEDWSFLQKNISALKAEKSLFLVENGHMTAPEKVRLIARDLVLSEAVRDRIAAGGRLADISDSFDDALKYANTRNTGVLTKAGPQGAAYSMPSVKEMVFKGSSMIDQNILYGEKLRDYLEHGLPPEGSVPGYDYSRASVVSIKDRQKASVTADLRRHIEEAKTPAQIRFIADALSQAAPKGIVPDGALKSLVAETRFASNQLNVTHVCPGYVPLGGSPKNNRRFMVRTDEVLKPEALEKMKTKLTDYCNLIDKRNDPEDFRFGRKYMSAYYGSLQQNARAFTGNRMLVNALEGLTFERIQQMEDIYAAMVREQSFWHRDSAQYKDMFGAMKAIHERALKGFDPGDNAALAEMSGLFADAFNKALIYSDKEVEGRTKRTQRGLDRKNFALAIIAGTSVYKEGDNTWYFPDSYDHRMSTDEDPNAVDKPELDELLTALGTVYEGGRENTIGRGPVKDAVRPAASRSSSDHMGKLQDALEKMSDDYRAQIESHLDKDRIEGLVQGGRESRALTEATGLRLDFSRTSGHSAFYAWLIAKKDYSIGRLMEMKDSDGTEARVYFDEFVRDMKTNYTNDPEGAKRLGELHRKVYDSLLEYRYPDKDVTRATDALQVQEAGAFINRIVVDLEQDCASVISKKDHPENYAAYMEGAGGMLEMQRVFRQVSSTTSVCSNIFDLGSRPDEVKYAERLAMFKDYWKDMRGKSLAECSGKTLSEYQRIFSVHSTSQKDYGGNEKAMEADRDAAPGFLIGADRELGWKDELDDRINSRVTELTLAERKNLARAVSAAADRPLLAMSDDIAALASYTDEFTPGMYRDASVMYTRIFGDLYDPTAIDRLSALGKDPFDLITIDGRSVKSLVDVPENKDLTPLDREQRMQAAVIVALGDPARKVEFAPLEIKDDATFAVSEKKHIVAISKPVIELGQGDREDVNLVEAAEAFLSGHPSLEPSGAAETALYTSGWEFARRVSDVRQEEALAAAGKDIFDCLFVNGRSINEIYATQYAAPGISGSRERNIKFAIFAASRMDEGNRVVYRPVKERTDNFELLDGISVGIGADVKGASKELRQAVAARAESDARIEEFISEYKPIAGVVDERATYGLDDLKGMNEAINLHAKGYVVTGDQRNLVSEINVLMDEIRAGQGPREKLFVLNPETWMIRETKEVLTERETELYHQALDKFSQLVTLIKKPPTKPGYESAIANMCRAVEKNSFMYRNKIYDLADRMTHENVQTLDELYQRLKAEGKHRNSDEFNAMYSALEKIHEAAPTFDPSDKKSFDRMAKLYTEAFVAADTYARKEAFKAKKTDLGIERKNVALVVLATVAKLQDKETAPETSIEVMNPDLTVLDEKGKKKKATSLSGLIEEERKATHAAFGEKAKIERHVRRRGGPAKESDQASRK